MQTFLVYYWMRQGDRNHSTLCQRLSAATYEEALEKIEDNLSKRTFTFVSENFGRVLVVSDHVQYVEIEEGGNLSEGLPEGFRH
ncbi:MAG: hypothetical protein QM758_22660 [Armatimonas sp.]